MRSMPALDIFCFRTWSTGRLANVDPTQGGAAHGSLTACNRFAGFPNVPGRIWTSRGHTHTQWQRLGGESGIYIPTIPLYILKVKTTKKNVSPAHASQPLRLCPSPGLTSVSTPSFRLVSQSCTIFSIPSNSSVDHNLQRQGNLLRQQLHGAL